jgi:hypothetical protein
MPGGLHGDAKKQARAAREGHHYEKNSEWLPCRRPGCYELFAAQARSPLKKFCSMLCRRALRRVLQREARWCERQQSSHGAFLKSGP